MSIKKTVIGVCVFLFFGLINAKAADASDYFISPTGNNSNSGTNSASPVKSFSSAWGKLRPGDTLYLMDGTYTAAVTGMLTNPPNGSGPSSTIMNDYKNYPLDHPDRVKNYIRIKALNDGKAIIDGKGTSVPVFLGSGNRFIEIVGIVAMNSSESTWMIQGKNINLKRVSGYNANTNYNWHVFEIWTQCANADSTNPNYQDQKCTPTNPSNILVEDAVAGGTGRKMFVAYGSYVNVVFRRVLGAWQSWRGGDCNQDACAAHWPWGDGIEIYNWAQPDISDADTANGYVNTIIENSIVYGRLSNWGFSVSPNPTKTYDNYLYGDMAVKVGLNYDGSQLDWPCPNPLQGWFPCPKYNQWQSMRAGFSFGAHGNSLFKDNLFQDLFAYGNAGVGIATGPYGAGSSNNRLVRISYANNATANNILPAERNQNWSPIGPASNLTSADTNKARLRYRYVYGQYMDGTNGKPAQELWPWPMEERIKTEFAAGYMVDNGTSGQFNPGQPVSLTNFSVTSILVPLLNQYTAQPINLNFTPTPSINPTATPVGTLMGDINNDKTVNMLDYTLLSNAFGTNNTLSDINKDGIVNVLDFTILSTNFGKVTN